jgi:heat shock protein HtpX
VFNLGAGGEAWHCCGIGQRTIPATWPYVSFALVPAADSRTQAPQMSRSDAGVIDLHLPTDRPDIALRCRIAASSQDLLRLRRDIHRGANHRSSAWAIAGMVLVLAACGWIVEGAEGVRRAVNMPRTNATPISPESMYRWFGARLINPAEMPGLFNILADVCYRAQLRRLPNLYYVAAPSEMNAYALGSPDGAAIILTDGLLRGMTPDEITGILAHEVAHIRNNDAWAMSWVAALHQAIEWTSLTGLALLRTRNGGILGSLPLAVLLNAAPAIGQLLGLALCRIRELDADATALELTGDLHGLVAALDKLERHHTGYPVRATAAVENSSMHLVRSHPATSERVGTLLSLAL